MNLVGLVILKMKKYRLLVESCIDEVEPELDGIFPSVFC